MLILTWSKKNPRNCSFFLTQTWESLYLYLQFCYFSKNENFCDATKKYDHHILKMQNQTQILTMPLIHNKKLSGTKTVFEHCLLWSSLPQISLLSQLYSIHNTYIVSWSTKIHCIYIYSYNDWHVSLWTVTMSSTITRLLVYTWICDFSQMFCGCFHQ